MKTALLVLAQEEGGVDLNPFNPEFGLYVWTLIAFGVVFFVLARRVFPKLSETLADRERRIQEDLENAEKTKAEAEKIFEEYRKKIAEAREESNKIIEEARNAADDVRKQLVAKAEGEARLIVDKAQKELESERERAVGELKGQLAAWSSDIAARIIEKEIDPQTHEKLVDSFIKDIGKQAKAS